MTETKDDQEPDVYTFAPSPPPERPPVRIAEIWLPAELHARSVCAICSRRPPKQDAFVVHVDRHQSKRGEKKAQSYLACSKACCDTLESSLVVEHAMLGVSDDPPTVEEDP